MDKKLEQTLLSISTYGLFIAAMILFGVQLFARPDNNNCLFAGFLCVSLGNLFQIVKTRKKQEK